MLHAPDYSKLSLDKLMMMLNERKQKDAELQENDEVLSYWNFYHHVNFLLATVASKKFFCY